MAESESAGGSKAVQGVVTGPSHMSFADTQHRIVSALEQSGIKIFAVIDQAEEAKKANIDLRPTTLVIFGSPVAGTPVMDAVPLAALDLPLKLLIWEDTDGVKISYYTAEELARRYDLPPNLASRLGGAAAVIEGHFPDFPA